VDDDIVGVLTKYLEKGFHRITYIGEIQELIDSIDILRGSPGFLALESLLGSLVGRPNPEEAWEDIEHALAVAKVASEYKNRGHSVELEQTLGQKDQKKPDFRALIANRWVYFEVKVSSMFPGEKMFLDNVLQKLREELPKIPLPWKYCLVLRYKESDARSELPYLLKAIKSLSRQILSIPRDKVGDIYIHPSAQAAIVFLKSYSPEVFGELLTKCMDVVQHIDVPTVVDQIVRNGYYVIALDSRIPKYKGEGFATVESEGMLIGRLSEEFEKTRLENALRTALGKAPQDEPYVVFVFSREAIMRKVTSEIVNDIFKDASFKQISALILDVESVKNIGEKPTHRRQTFKNSDADTEIDGSVL